MWISHSDTKRLTKGISKEAVSDFLEMWNTDVPIIKEFEFKKDGIELANGYLRYFGSEYYAVDVQWDKRTESFMWNLKQYVKS